MNKKHILGTIQKLIIIVGTLSCTGANLYKDLASNKSSDEALYEDAQKLIDDGDYTGGIAKLLATTPGFQATSRVKESLAGAYAGRCGMEFLPFVNNLTGGSSSSFYSLAMSGFVGVDTGNYADCKTAEEVIESIGAIGARTQSQNLFLLILQMAKIGNRIRSVADISPTATGDGTVDGGFHCLTSVPIGEAQEIIESFYKFMAQFAVVGTTLGGVGGVSDFIEDYGGALPPIDYTGGTDPAGSDEGHPVIMISRGLINSQDFGVGSCNDPDPTQCVCL